MIDKNIYNALISRAKHRITPNGQYYEKHHIIPRSMGGGDEASNIVNLSVHEHRLCHMLLYRMYRKTNPKLVFAITAFYEDANAHRIALRVRRPMVKWIRKERTLATHQIIRDMGFGKTQRFNTLPVKQRRKRVGLDAYDAKIKGLFGDEDK